MEGVLLCSVNSLEVLQVQEGRCCHSWLLELCGAVRADSGPNRRSHGTKEWLNVCLHILNLHWIIIPRNPASVQAWVPVWGGEGSIDKHTRIKQFKEKCLLTEQKSKAKLLIASGFVNYVVFYDGLEEWHLLASDCFLSGKQMSVIHEPQTSCSFSLFSLSLLPKAIF